MVIVNESHGAITKDTLPPQLRFATPAAAFRIKKDDAPTATPRRTTIDDFHLFEPTTSKDEQDIQRRLEKQLISEISVGEPKLFEFGDVLDVIQQGVQALVEDDFTKAFTQRPGRPWNWNFYLFPIWAVGVFVRYCILLPVRLFVLCVGWLAFFAGLFVAHVFFAKSKLKPVLQRKLIVFICNVFVFSWTGVIKFHGVRPPRRPNQIYVANHTTMADVIVLMMQQPYAIVGQKHPGWLGLIQNHVLSSLGCLWFERTDQDDRARVGQMIKSHISDSNRPPLLIFPEGTCVNNEFCVQFKKGVFDLGATIVPVAIRYNKIFCDAFWHSRKESFAWYLFRLMTSWCVMCDVHYLEPMTAHDGEDAVVFAQRVQQAICNKIGLKIVPWDGYLKFLKLSPKFMEEQQKVIADSIRRRLEARTPKSPAGRAAIAAPTAAAAAAAAAAGGGGSDGGAIASAEADTPLKTPPATAATTESAGTTSGARQRKRRED